MFETQSFHDLRDTALAEILQSDNLTVDEMKIIDAVNEWAEVNKVSKRRSTRYIDQWVKIDAAILI